MNFQVIYKVLAASLLVLSCNAQATIASDIEAGKTVVQTIQNAAAAGLDLDTIIAELLAADKGFETIIFSLATVRVSAAEILESLETISVPITPAVMAYVNNVVDTIQRDGSNLPMTADGRRRVTGDYFSAPGTMGDGRNGRDGRNGSEGGPSLILQERAPTNGSSSGPRPASPN